jgi:hypothetical protein
MGAEMFDRTVAGAVADGGKGGVRTAPRQRRSPAAPRAIVLAPVVVTAACVLLCLSKAGRRFYDWITAENNVVEMSTFLLLVAGMVLAVRTAVLLRRRKEYFTALFYALFAVGLFVTAGEEIAWGQSLLHFKTPQHWSQINVQHETNLHNLQPMQGHNDWLRFLFGFGGAVGVALGALLAPRWRYLWPDRLLLSWFLVIAAQGAAQIYPDLFPRAPLAGAGQKLARLAEMIELLIAAAGFLYVRFTLRKLRARAPGAACGGMAGQ